MVAASNGELIEVIQNPPQHTVTWHWKQHEPVSSYLYCVAISDYVILTDPTYDWIKFYAYRADSANAVASFSNVHLMMDAFQKAVRTLSLHREIRLCHGGRWNMEHVGLVAHRYNYVNGGHNYRLDSGLRNVPHVVGRQGYLRHLERSVAKRRARHLL